ncbi:MAG: hypothetical protein N3F08_01105 [Crenarchaeota archaeon]|nr:hypothetical protein [Thermoproteota archaeon]
MKINKIIEEKGKKPLDLKKNIDAILSLPLVWLDFLIIKRASEYTYPVTGIDYVYVATMEINFVWEVISAYKELDKIKFIRRIEPKEYN